MSRVVVISDDVERPMAAALRAVGHEVLVVESDMSVRDHRRQAQLQQIVERRDGDRKELLTAGQALRYDLMVVAVEAGLRAPPGASWWPELAPLRAVERRGVKAEVVKRRTQFGGDA